MVVVITKTGSARWVWSMSTNHLYSGQLPLSFFSSMRVNSKNYRSLFNKHVNRFDPESRTIKKECLSFAKHDHNLSGKVLLGYHDRLLFLLAHPDDEHLRIAAEQELGRVTRLLKHGKIKALPGNSGLPYSEIETLFSQDMCQWFLQQNYRVDGEPYNKEAFVEALRVTLPAPERELLSYGYSYDDLLEALRLKPKQVYRFLVEQMQVLDQSPLVKDHFFDATETYTRLRLHDKALSRSYNRFLKAPVFYQDGVVKRFDHLALMNTALPSPTPLGTEEQESLISTIKNSLVLTARETDPATYLLPASLRYYELERGIAIAIYGMQENRQLPFESYVGYTLFKNGFPAAYGGAWVFGKRSLFGMNIFEAFRGGESGYMMCQLLRVYRQVFGVDVFEVEPYQFGKDNPDGIRSGAFWFYYRHGFRPVDKQINKLAQAEAEKTARQAAAGKKYQSPYKTLERFTDSFIALEFAPVKQEKVTELNTLITGYIQKQFDGKRQQAEQASLSFVGLSGAPNKAAKEYALLSGAMQLKDEHLQQIVKELIATKAKDLYAYQQLVLRFFERLRMIQS